MTDEKEKKPSGGGNKPRRKSPIRETVEVIVVALVLAVFVRTFVIQAFKIPSSSMEDTLLIGDHLLVNKLSYGIQVPHYSSVKIFGVTVPFFDTSLKRAWGGIKHGDVIVFRFPMDGSKDFIKRVVALPGEKVEVRGKTVYVNGVPREEAYVVFKGAASSYEAAPPAGFGPYVVPEGQVFVMGDNRDRSYDSRFWGGVPIENIRGRALVLYFSWDGQHNSIRFSRFAKVVR